MTVGAGSEADRDAPGAGGPAPGEQRRRPRVSWPLYVFFALVAGAAAAGVSWGFLSDSLEMLGISDPGRLTTAGLPFLRGVGWIVAALGTGSFLASAFFIRPRLPEGKPAAQGILEAPLNVDGYLAARTGSLAALTYGCVALASIPTTLSDVSGVPLSEAARPEAWPTAISQVSAAQAWLAVAIISFVVGILGLASKKWTSQPLLFIGGLFMVVPLGLDGHSAAGGNHDWGLSSLLWHLIFLMIWVGGLMALVAHCRRLGPGLAVAVRRYSTLALVSIIGLAASGVVNAALRVSVTDLFSTAYGLIIVTKTVGIVALALLGFAHRSITIPQLEREPSNPAPFRRLAIVEVALMALVAGIAVTMGRTPPPAPNDPNISPMELTLGFELEREPTFWNIWTMWRPELIFGVAGVAFAALYVYGVVKLKRRGEPWSGWRTTSFLIGAITLAVMMSNGLGMNMMALFSVHMLVHMGLAMVVPVFLVLGAPFRLIMAVVPPVEERPEAHGVPGLYEWTSALCFNRLTGWITHPGVNTAQFLVFFYLVYVTPLYDLLVSDHGGHVGMNFVFLLSGYLYFWEMIGADPLERRHSVPVRLLWLMLSMPFHLYFGVYLMQLEDIIAEDFYSTLNLPWDPDLLLDQQVGGGIAWATGSFPLVVVFGVLFWEWFTTERDEGRRQDRKADESDVDEDVEAYNAWLQSLGRGEDLDGYYTGEMPGPAGRGRADT